MQRGIESIRWLFIGTVVVTLLVNPLFGLLVSRFRRLVFIGATYLFFAAGLVAFYALLVLAPAAIGERSGQVFYVWFSVFNLFATMLFWALMADRFSLEQTQAALRRHRRGRNARRDLRALAREPCWQDRSARRRCCSSPPAFLVLALGAAGWLARLPQPGGALPAVEHAVIGGSAWEGFQAVSRSPYLLAICGVRADPCGDGDLPLLHAPADGGGARNRPRPAHHDVRAHRHDHPDGNARAAGDRHRAPHEAARRGADAGAAAAHRGAGLPGPGDRRLARRARSPSRRLSAPCSAASCGPRAKRSSPSCRAPTATRRRRSSTLSCIARATSSARRPRACWGGWAWALAALASVAIPLARRLAGARPLAGSCAARSRAGGIE